MANKDTLTGATNAMTMLLAYVDRAGKELGQDQALALHGETCRSLGGAQGRQMREQADVEEMDLRTAQALLGGSIAKAFGIGSEILDAGPREVRFHVGRCPVYDAAKALGMGDDAIEAACRAGSIAFMDAMAKELNPKLRYELRRFRSHGGDTCEEAVVSA